MRLADLELPSLVARARKGDRVAFEKVVQGTARVVYAQIVAMVRDRQKAEDLTQETFVSAWKGLGSFEAGGEGHRRDADATAGNAVVGDRFMSWLLTLARHAALDAIRFESRQRREAARNAPGVSAAGVADVGRSPAESAEAVEARERALAVLEELPTEYRRVLALRYLGGADYETICKQLGISDGVLRGLLSRGMALMRERMGAMKK
jgi:RNA polymerase sigma-70 factor (ECF subfamily)